MATSAATYINQKIKTRDTLKAWILRQLGSPLITVELTTEHLDDAIDNATLLWTKYATMTIKYLSLNLGEYPNANEEEGTEEGFDLSEYRVAAVASIASGESFGLNGGGDQLFGLANSMVAGGSYPFFNQAGAGKGGGGWTTFQSVVEFIKLSKRMMATEFDFSYNPATQRLKLLPNPTTIPMYGWTCIQCEVIPPDSELYGNEYIKRIALANAKIMLGTIRKKFTSVTLPGGGQIDITIGDEGKDELKTIIENIRKEEFVIRDHLRLVYDRLRLVNMLDNDVDILGLLNVFVFKMKMDTLIRRP